MNKMGTLGRELRIAVIGVGGRGFGQMCTLLGMPDVKVAVVCDLYQDRVDKACEKAAQMQGFRPDGELDYRKVIRRDDIEAVVIMTSWQTHVKIAIAAMRAGKHVAMEVGGASSVDECWQMVRTSEDTGKICMILENCCYDEKEMALLNLVKKGLFGEMVHCEGGYCHDLRDEIGNGDIIRHYRLDNFMRRNGELYPTHEIGPIAKYLNINYGNRFMSLVSMASKAVGMHAWMLEKRPDCQYVNEKFNEGDVVTTIIKCANGETVTLTHDCSLPRPYSRRLMLQGTKGIWEEDKRAIYLEGISPVKEGEWCHSWQDDNEYMEKYQHPLWKEYKEFGLRGGHGGMDYLVLRSFVESVQNGTEPPIDVYDTATWMVITCLSEESVAMGGMPVPFPDFTDGEWMTRKDGDKGMFSLGIIPE